MSGGSRARADGSPALTTRFTHKDWDIVEHAVALYLNEWVDEDRPGEHTDEDIIKCRAKIAARWERAWRNKPRG